MTANKTHARRSCEGRGDRRHGWKAVCFWLSPDEKAILDSIAKRSDISITSLLRALIRANEGATIKVRETMMVVAKSVVRPSKRERKKP